MDDQRGGDEENRDIRDVSEHLDSVQQVQYNRLTDSLCQELSEAFSLYQLTLNIKKSEIIKVKLSAKCNPGFICECTRVKPSCKRIITMKEALLRFTVFLFSGQTHFQWECYGHFYNSIIISMFKTVRSLDTT